MSDFNYIIEDGKVVNVYQPLDTPDVVFPPRHLGQKWEVFEPDKWTEKDMLDYTGQMETHSVYGIQLCELIESGVFDWNNPLIDWKSAAYDDEQYTRFCNYFVERFYFRDIGITPFRVWANYFHRMMVYELMPKYKPLYARIAESYDPLADSDEYYKRRTINSAYPETMLSGNSDYISDGTDEEWERIKEGSYADKMNQYIAEFKGIDEAMADELEVLFVCMYTSYANVL